MVEKSLQGNPKAKASTVGKADKSSSLTSVQITLSVLWGGANVGCVCGACVRIIVCSPLMFDATGLCVSCGCG